jgi:hypothetical protein
VSYPQKIETLVDLLTQRGDLQSLRTNMSSTVVSRCVAAPPTATFLEVEYQGLHYLDLWGVPDSAHVVEANRLAAEARANLAEADLAATRRSRSWRMTSPLRQVANLARAMAKKGRSRS